MAPGVRVLLEMDIPSVKKPERGQWKVKVEGDRFPLAWCQRVGAGRTFYTALGHNREHYGDPAFRQHLLGAILWAMDIQEAP
jgi:type 1 glutamine amidotransferase